MTTVGKESVSAAKEKRRGLTPSHCACAWVAPPSLNEADGDVKVEDMLDDDDDDDDDNGDDDDDDDELYNAGLEVA